METFLVVLKNTVQYRNYASEKKKIKMGEENNLLRIDDKAELFLDTVRDFKAEKNHETIDWESIKNKYERLKERFI